MQISGKVVVITGGSGGIGSAMAEKFLAGNAKAVVLADLDQSAVETAAAALGCSGLACDVTREAQVQALV